MREVCATCPDFDLANLSATLHAPTGSVLASVAASGVKLHHVPAHEPLAREGTPTCLEAPPLHDPITRITVAVLCGAAKRLLWLRWLRWLWRLRLLRWLRP